MRIVGHSSGITRPKKKDTRKSHCATGTTRFIAVDGEGINLDNGDHVYGMLSIGSDPEWTIVDESGLDWETILAHLYSYHLSNGAPGTAYVGFYLSYDFDRWLCTMPRNKVGRLLTTEGRESRKSKSAYLHSRVLPVDMPNGWQINMLGKKMFEFRRRNCHCDLFYCKCPGKGPWMRICDTGPFFQSSFLAAIDPSKWQTPIVSVDEYEFIKKNKENRAYATEFNEEMAIYNRLENEILARLMNVLNSGFREMGIVLAPRQWFGPGQAAQKWMKNNNIPTAETMKEKLCLESLIIPSLPPAKRIQEMRQRFAFIRKIGDQTPTKNTVQSHGVTVNVIRANGQGSSKNQWEPLPGEIESMYFEAARQSYFGGWFEIMMHGIIPGESHEYDINSAYPHVISSLPCLLHGKWYEGSNTSPPDTRFVLVYASVSNYRAKHKSTIGTMLHRESDGKIHRPTRTKGWYWHSEIKAAKRAKLIARYHIYEWMAYDPCDCVPPMRNVQFLYDLRIKVGKDTPLGKGCRLAYNSMYGKFAQSIGNPIFANSVWASLITSGCRTMILDAIASHPKGKTNVCMVATDAVFFCDPHPDLSISKKLGEWDYECRNNLTLFKPGVYWDDNTRRDISENRSPHFKARGIAAADFASSIERIDRTFQEWNSISPNLSSHSGMVEGWPYIEFITGFSMITCLMAIRRGKWELAGQVNQEMKVAQNANPYDKRIGAWPEQLDDGRIIWRSEPWTLPINDCESKPYQKRFGMDDPWSLERMEMYGITPDGSPADIIQDKLGLR